VATFSEEQWNVAFLDNSDDLVTTVNTWITQGLAHGASQVKPDSQSFVIRAADPSRNSIREASHGGK
jgi:hypothetical protein